MSVEQLKINTYFSFFTVHEKILSKMGLAILLNLEVGDAKAIREADICLYGNVQRPSLIEEQLNSIFPQLSEHDELIISDDHSTDGTWEFLLELEEKDSRIKLFRNNGQGLIANFANAIERSAHSIIF